MARWARAGVARLVGEPVMRGERHRSERALRRDAPTPDGALLGRLYGAIGRRARSARVTERLVQANGVLGGYGSERVARAEGGGAGRWEVRRGLRGPGGSGGGGRRHDLGVSSAKLGVGKSD